MKSTGSIAAGLALSLACQLALLLVLGLWLGITKNILLYFVLLLSGLAQWILVLPLMLRFRSQGKSATVRGMLIMSVLGMVVNAVFLATMFANNANSTGPLF